MTQAAEVRVPVNVTAPGEATVLSAIFNLMPTLLLLCLKVPTVMVMVLVWLNKDPTIQSLLSSVVTVIVAVALVPDAVLPARFLFTPPTTPEYSSHPIATLELVVQEAVKLVTPAAAV